MIDSITDSVLCIKTSGMFMFSWYDTPRNGRSDSAVHKQGSTFPMLSQPDSGPQHLARACRQ
eukprot:1666613-Lingulodinium_polyedra.AAC.1